VDVGDGLMSVNVTLGHGNGVTKGYQCWIDKMDAQLLSAMNSKTASQLGLKFQVVITWGNNKLTYTFSDATVAGYMAYWETYAMYLTVTGAEGLNLQYQFQVAYAGATAGTAAVRAADTVNH
jgi:hypothetical protein